MAARRMRLVCAIDTGRKVLASYPDVWRMEMTPQLEGSS